MLGEKYSVEPNVFVGIHIIATPLFAAAVGWLIYNQRKGKSILLPAIIARLIFNAANIYLSDFRNKHSLVDLSYTYYNNYYQQLFHHP